MTELDIIVSLLQKGVNNGIYNQAEVYAINNCVDAIKKKIDEQVQETTVEKTGSTTC